MSSSGSVDYDTQSVSELFEEIQETQNAFTNIYNSLAQLEDAGKMENSQEELAKFVKILSDLYTSVTVLVIKLTQENHGTDTATKDLNRRIHTRLRGITTFCNKITENLKDLVAGAGGYQLASDTDPNARTVYTPKGFAAQWQLFNEHHTPVFISCPSQPFVLLRMIRELLEMCTERAHSLPS